MTDETKTSTCGPCGGTGKVNVQWLAEEVGAAPNPPKTMKCPWCGGIGVMPVDS